MPIKHVEKHNGTRCHSYGKYKVQGGKGWKPLPGFSLRLNILKQFSIQWIACDALYSALQDEVYIMLYGVARGVTPSTMASEITDIWEFSEFRILKKQCQCDLMRPNLTMCCFLEHFARYFFRVL